jgi:hypothetical protein
LPKFTLLLQTSPTNVQGEFVNSLPPIKSPSIPLASGDTVPPTWLTEIATMADVTALLEKQMETLNARIAALETKIHDLSSQQKPEPLPPPSPEAPPEQKNTKKNN